MDHTTNTSEFFGYDTFEIYNQTLFDKLLKATKQVNLLPNQAQYEIQITDRKYKQRIKGIESKILSMLQEFLRRYKPQGTPIIQKTLNSNDSEDDEEETSEQFDITVDLIDTLLEKVDMILDDMSGISNKPVNNVVVKTRFSPSATKVSSVNNHIYIDLQQQ